MSRVQQYVRSVARSERDILTSLGLQQAERPLPTWIGGISSDWALEPELLRILFTLVERIRPSVVVELGTYEGRTAAALGCLLRDLKKGHIFTVDDFRAIDSVHSQSLFRKLSLERVLTQITKTTVDAFSEWGRASIDLLLIDASHDYVSSCIDFALWSRLVNGDGWIIIHDTKNRLLRRFPEDYIHPLSHYVVFEVVDVAERTGERPWEGVAFVRHRDRSPLAGVPHKTAVVTGIARWAGALEG